MLIFNKEVIDYAFEKVNPYSMYVLLLIFWAPHKQRKKKKKYKIQKKIQRNVGRKSKKYISEKNIPEHLRNGQRLFEEDQNWI